MNLEREDEIITAGLFVRIDAVERFAPEGLSATTKGGITLNGPMIIQKLFGIERRQVEEWRGKAPHGLVLAFANPASGAWIGGAADAAGQLASSLISNYTAEQIRGFDFYVVAREDIKAYFIVVGHISNPPANATVGRLLG